MSSPYRIVIVQPAWKFPFSFLQYDLSTNKINQDELKGCVINQDAVQGPGALLPPSHGAASLGRLVV